MTPRQRQLVLALAATQVADAGFNAVAKQWVIDDLEHLRLPQEMRLVFPMVKASSAIGLLAGLRFGQLGRLTACLLVAYFVLAVSAHLRIRDRPRNCATALAMLAWSIWAWASFKAAPNGLEQ